MFKVSIALDLFHWTGMVDHNCSKTHCSFRLCNIAKGEHKIRPHIELSCPKISVLMVRRTNIGMGARSRSMKNLPTLEPSYNRMRLLLSEQSTRPKSEVRAALYQFQALMIQKIYLWRLHSNLSWVTLKCKSKPRKFWKPDYLLFRLFLLADCAFVRTIFLYSCHRQSISHEKIQMFCK